eukprot:1190904-Prorocentrum_minimum.AAC.1
MPFETDTTAEAGPQVRSSKIGNALDYCGLMEMSNTLRRSSSQTILFRKSGQVSIKQTNSALESSNSKTDSLPAKLESPKSADPPRRKTRETRRRVGMGLPPGRSGPRDTVLYLGSADPRSSRKQTREIRLQTP